MNIKFCYYFANLRIEEIVLYLAKINIKLAEIHVAMVKLPTPDNNT
jgi:hypothetical protein